MSLNKKECLKHWVGSHARRPLRDLSFDFWSLFAEAKIENRVRRLGRTTYEMFVRCIFGSKRCERRDTRRKVHSPDSGLYELGRNGAKALKVISRI